MSDRLETGPDCVRSRTAPRAARRRPQAAPSCARSERCRRSATPWGSGVGGRANADARAPPSPRRDGAFRDAVAVSEGGAVPKRRRCAGPFKEVLDLAPCQPGARGAGARLRLAHARRRATCWRWWRSASASRRCGDAPDAARAYGSIIDLVPRARRHAPVRRRAPRARGAARRPLALAIDTYRKAVEQRPDHPAGHHLLGFALLKAGQPARGVRGCRRRRRSEVPGRNASAASSASCARTWACSPPPGPHAEPARAGEIRDRLRARGGTPESGPSMRFILNWETDANDVDFHIHDARGGHAFYSAAASPLGRRSLRRRHHRLRPGVLHHPRPGRRPRRPLPAAGALLQPRVRWATAWASCRSSTTTATATCASTSGRSSSCKTAPSSTSAASAAVGSVGSGRA